MSTRLRLAAGALAAVFLAVYLPDLGHGFIQDDFRWIRTSVSHSSADILALFSKNVGFYRPLVSVTFAWDFAVWGLDPFGYGVTNLALCIASALLFFALMHRFALPTPAALLATAVWAFNLHGINMGLLWLSGRTALLVSVFALAAALAFLGGRRLTAGLLCLGALLCKEEAVLLPAVFTGFAAWVDGSSEWQARFRRVAVQTWPLWTSLTVYALLRMQSGAMGPLTAPWYYRFSFSPTLVLRNVLEYADRAGTVAFVAVLVLAVVLRGKPQPLADHERRALRFAVIWIVGTFALTVFLPVRSSLYAVLPSLGSALAAGVFASLVLRTRPDRFRFAAAALMALLLALTPVYRLRNVRWVEPADRSTRVMQTLHFATSTHAAGGHVVLVDDPTERFNLDTVFGSLFPDAVSLFLGRAWTGEIAGSAPVATRATVVYRYRDGGIVPVLDLPH